MLYSILSVGNRLALATAVLTLFGLGVAAQAQTVNYTFTFNDPAGNIGTGTLTAADQGSGEFLVTSGTLAVTASQSTDIAVGTYTLFPAGPAEVNLTVLLVDNLLFPGGTAGESPVGAQIPDPSFIDNDGLVFQPDGTLTSGAEGYINLYGNGNNDYSFIGVNSTKDGYDVLGPTGGTFTLTALPEPASLGVVGIGAVGLLARRRRR